MSTRRARIKAVASLPVRRKNVDSQVKDDKPIKSPKTPRPHALQDEIPKTKNAANKIASPVQVVRTPHEQSKTETPKHAEFILSPPPKSIPMSETNRTPKQSEKVPVITSISAQNVSNTFASPLRWSSPARRNMPSPVRNSSQPRTPSVITEATFQRFESPNSVQSNPDVSDKQKNVVPYAAEKIIQKNATEKLDHSEDYNPPSIPESITDETGMDGIIPLQPTCSAPKPLDLLKNEIISENAQVLFDPIVPLPSPSKVRPKLRPAPRLAPHRRNSIQGSASESEDESRRALLNSGAPTPVPTRQRHDSHTSHSTLQSLPNREVSRIRNDSVCSGVSQLTAPPPASPLKERHVTKCRRQEMSRRIAAMRRRRDPVKRDALTMYDLIFYNPTTNPIVPDQDELKAKEANQKDEEERKKAPVEEDPDDPDDPPPDAAPVPQIKLGPNGEIMLDEQSLVIKQTDSNRKLAAAVVREGAWGGGGGRYSRAARTADWSEPETVRFYRALAAVGTDFTLMAPLFPDRTRRDLKIKFKKEERLNGAQVDKALRSQVAWDAAGLEGVFSREREAAARRAAAEREQLQAARRAQRQRTRAQHAVGRPSRGAKALEVVGEPGSRELTTADDFIQHALASKPRRKRKTPDPTVTPNQDSDISQSKNTPKITPPTNVSRIDPSISQVPPNIEVGSLVVLTVNDPKSPTKKMLQTYISRGAGQLTPVALPPNLLTSVMGYVKKGTPRSNVSSASSPLLSPASVASVDSRTSGSASANVSSVIQLNPSPNKRQRHSSYTITQL